MRGLPKWVPLLFIVALLPMPVYSQHHHGPVTGMIDGATHPELISDVTAYRLFLLAIADNQSFPSMTQYARQHVFMKMSGLTDADFNQALSIIDDFKATYSQLIAQYNTFVQNTNAGASSAKSRRVFLAKRDALVQATRGSLASILSAQAMLTLDNYVRAEKKHMKVAQEEQ